MNEQKMKGFFSDAERKSIEKAVALAEAATSGEIAVMVVPCSDSYREAETLGAVLLAGLISLVTAIALGHITIWTYIPLVFLLFIPCRVLLRKVPALKLPFVGRERIAEAVRERAVRAFYEKNLYRTVGESGILIFLSLLERKVWILADRGIDRKIPHGDWEELAREITAGIKQGQAHDALCRVIDTCGRMLADHFPKLPDDVNELPDDLIM